ncbi:MAG: ATP-dependent DNA helicase RecG [Elusimicrobiota bacterium]|jgi:ATP-dependent DNA helicase RecG|nr:ATP-dependent DNA helicase RecG [Elusimicrobiota bacterium]
MDLESGVQYLKGIGPKKALGFEKLGIKTIADLLLFFPIQYQDRAKIQPISDIVFDLPVCIFGRVGGFFERKLSMNLFIADIEIFDNTGKTYARFFRKKNPYSQFDAFAGIKRAFEFGKFAYIFGDAKSELGARYISVNDYEIVENPNISPQAFNKLIPVYPGTESLSQKNIRETVKFALDEFGKHYPDISNIIPQFNAVQNIKSYQAVQQIHYPPSLEQAENARRAFAMQEFIILETALALSRSANKILQKKQKYKIEKTLLTPFREKLKFDFTKSQKKCINEIFADMQNPSPMNRMLMGDVGSGKTIVALSAILLAVENSYQTMIIAPTEILAEQHFTVLSSILEGLNIKIALLTSSTLSKKKNRETILSEIENGLIDIAIGTHSLIEDRIKFKDIALIVIDEQHRFGVMQKMSALDKAENPDILMMTATPIPRTLAMTAYGEMDMSVISELPPGRIPIKTQYTTEEAAYNFTIEELKKGGQAYIVYPIIDESDKSQLKSATNAAEILSKTYFKNFKTGLLHGRMKQDEKNEIMRKFKNKDFDILISTTVIEVGIDVPNASIMIIENAASFGLSNLHQLRGRVGRGNRQSFCFLLGQITNENAQRRINIMTKTNNGFEIAEEDLKIRGPGELLGTLQHGFLDFKAGNLIKDADIIDFAKDFARKLIDEDPSLNNSENLELKKLILKNFSKKLKLVNIG